MTDLCTATCSVVATTVPFLPVIRNHRKLSNDVRQLFAHYVICMHFEYYLRFLSLLLDHLYLLSVSLLNFCILLNWSYTTSRSDFSALTKEVWQVTIKERATTTTIVPSLTCSLAAGIVTTDLYISFLMLYHGKPAFGLALGSETIATVRDNLATNNSMTRQLDDTTNRRRDNAAISQHDNSTTDQSFKVQTYVNDCYLGYKNITSLYRAYLPLIVWHWFAVELLRCPVVAFSGCPEVGLSCPQVVLTAELHCESSVGTKENVCPAFKRTAYFMRINNNNRPRCKHWKPIQKRFILYTIDKYNNIKLNVLKKIHFVLNSRVF